MHPLINSALLYKEWGYSILPIKDTKESYGKWKQYQTTPIHKDQIQHVFSKQQVFGIALICGAASKNLEVIDIDLKYDTNNNLFERFSNSIKNKNPRLSTKLTIAKSRNNGIHIFYRSRKISRNTILARRPSTGEELAKEPNQKVKILVETRGEGGYIITNPTPGYHFIQNSLRNVPVISQAERNLLLNEARSFNIFPEQQDLERTKTNFSRKGSPFSDFNARGNVIALLQNHGWTVVKETKLKTYVLRPGKSDHKTSGDYHHQLGLFGVFTTSTEFIPKRGYRPAAVYAILECGGNFSQAAKTLIKKGFGVSYKRQKRIH